MTPTLEVYDIIVMDGNIQFGDIQTGDIIVFNRLNGHEHGNYTSCGKNFGR